MPPANRDYQRLCEALLHAESEGEVTELLRKHGLLDTRHWKPLGNIPNNRSMVNNQQQDPAGALVEKVINGIDAMLTKECFLRGILPDSAQAPPTMAAAAEKFFDVRDGNLANLSAAELTRLAENIQVVATGSKQEPCYLVIDQGEGQTPARFEDTFLSLVRTNKARIPFVQGKFNMGGTGVLPFCGTQSYELIVSRRCRELPSDPSSTNSRDTTHEAWGFTLLRRLPPSAGLYDTMVYVYLAPDGSIPHFDGAGPLVLPEIGGVAPLGESDDDEDENDEATSSKDRVPRPYREGMSFGTIIKLYNYRWRAKSLATRDVRFELERYLYRLSLPVRVIETRPGYHAHYFATTVSGTSVTVAKDREKGFLEDGFPAGGEIQPDGLGTLPVSIALYRERQEGGQKAKALKRLPRGLHFTINGQVHYSVGPEFFVTRGLHYDFIKDTMLVTVDCTGLPEDVRDQLVMPSRDRLRRVAEFEALINTVVADLKDRDMLRAINDSRRLRRTREALTQEAVQDVFQSLINRDPIFASLMQNGRGLRNPYNPGPALEPYKGKLPPTYFQFENGDHEIVKSFSVDRTCAVELETDAVNGYFELPSPLDRGQISIEPKCYERWNLWNGRLRVVFRAPSNARIRDSLKVSMIVTDPSRSARGDAPWVNYVVLKFVEGGKEVRSGGPQRKKKQEVGTVGVPEVVLVRKDRWDEHKFNERSALRIARKDDGSHVFFVNMDNTYLLNELMRRKDVDREAAKFAYQWGIVIVALGMLQELKRSAPVTEAEKYEDKSEQGERTEELLEEQVSRFSTGVAAVIIPIVLNLMDSMKTADLTPVAVAELN